MRAVSGTFKLPASDIDLYFGVGFVPDWVKLYSMNANEQFAHWTIHMMRHASVIGGIEWDDDGAISANTVGIGISPYRGGDVVTSTQATAGNCLVWDKLDYSKASNHDPVTYSDINKWTLDAALTGHWNTECNTTYVGVGSLIWIDSNGAGPKRYIVTGLTSNGEQSTEVTINESGVPTGNITKITSMYDLKTASANVIMPAGFLLDSTADLLTATSEQAFFEAGTYDN